jgi:glycosyltransferase involved in cell wall biosynthesis
MDGFSMQETNFPVVTLVVDDASTDGEQEIIRKYLADNFQTPCRTEETDDFYLICANHATNVNCTFVVFLLKYNHYSIKKSKIPYLGEWLDSAKYLALCEGDDYWISSVKLQKQVDYLELHPDFSLCFHGARIETEDEKYPIIKTMKRLDCREYTAEEIYDNWTIPTASVLYRKDVNIEKDKRFVYGDLVLFLSCAVAGKMFCLGDTMSVYRRHSNGMSTSNTSFLKIINHQLALKDHFPQLKKIMDIHIARKFVIYFFMGGLNKDSWDVCKVLIKHPRYIIPSIKYLPSFFVKYFKH